MASVIAVELNISRRASGFTIFGVETMGRSKANLVPCLLVIRPGVQQDLAFFTKHLIVTSAGPLFGWEIKEELKDEVGSKIPLHSYYASGAYLQHTKKALLMKDRNN